MLGTESTIFHLSWKQYYSQMPQYTETGVLESGKPLIRAWRDNSWVIYAAWKALMQKILSPIAWEMLQEVLKRREMLREVYLKEGGWLITKAGTRRKRHVKGQRKPNPRTLMNELKRAYRLFREVSDPRAEIVLIAYSGAIYSASQAGTTSRKASIQRARDGYAKLKWKKPRYIDTDLLMKVGILKKPGIRKGLK